MKKSKIIVPALAMIGLSAVASVTGSVAWFTAQRSAEVTAGNYAVVKTNAELTCVTTGGVGTSATNNVVTVDSGFKLTDASFDHTRNSEALYAPDTAGASIAKKSTLAEMATASNIVRDADNNIYSAFTFHLAFTLSFGGAGNDVALFLDNTAGNTAFTVNGGGEAKTAQGFRMAFVGTGTNVANTNNRVLADLQNKTETDAQSQQFTAIKHVDSLSSADTQQKKAINGVEYLATDLMDTTYSTALPEDNASTLAQVQDRPDYLGKFTFAANTDVVLNYTVVAWFEGTDPEIKNREAADFQTVAANLVFKAVTLKA